MKIQNWGPKGTWETPTTSTQGCPHPYGVPEKMETPTHGYHPTKVGS